MGEALKKIRAFASISSFILLKYEEIALTASTKSGPFRVWYAFSSVRNSGSPVVPGSGVEVKPSAFGAGEIGRDGDGEI